MQTFPVSLALVVRAESQAQAFGIARGAAQHLRETFNDDGTLAQAEAVPPATHCTPGPWVSAKPSFFDPNCTRHVTDAAGRLVARVNFANAVQSEAEAIANAEMIAAAPQLRAALAVAVDALALIRDGDKMSGGEAAEHARAALRAIGGAL